MTSTLETPQRVPPLTPFTLSQLLGRIAHEWHSRKRIFDLPTARFFDVSSGPDLSTEVLGRPIATPVGPAAGPHSQLAENIVLAWLAGARFMELKTVQVLDELEINRPCIDMQTIGFNIEWSQELKIAQSLDEYVKAWMIVEILGGWEELKQFLGPDSGACIFDLSVGYDLAGISAPTVAAFIDSMMDATTSIDRLRADIPPPFEAWRDYPFRPRIADTATLSTFHGCPPDEIEAITKHLMTRHGLDVIVKLNPTLLGFDRVGTVLAELGYHEIVIRRQDFDNDLQFPRAIELIGELERFAADHGRRFGVKLTNTLVVANHKKWLPDETMYLSGPPLHVISTTLLGELDRALPGRLKVDGRTDAPIQVSFSAGIGKENLPSVAGLGLAPITICSDLLKPGGYGRLKPMLTALQEAINGAAGTSLVEWVRQSAEKGAITGGAVATYVATLHDPAGNGDYTAAGNSKLPREVDHHLEMWGCVACNFCVTVCPNDAFFKVPTPEGSGIDGRQQYLVFAELCNECGNCLTFCPEEGDPALIKPRLYLDPDRFAAAGGQAFLLGHLGDKLTVTAYPGFESEIPRLAGLLNAEEGLPIPPHTLL